MRRLGIWDVRHASIAIWRGSSLETGLQTPCAQDVYSSVLSARYVSRFSSATRCAGMELYSLIRVHLGSFTAFEFDIALPLCIWLYQSAARSLAKTHLCSLSLVGFTHLEIVHAVFRRLTLAALHRGIGSGYPTRQWWSNIRGLVFLRNVEQWSSDRCRAGDHQ